MSCCTPISHSLLDPLTTNGANERQIRPTPQAHKINDVDEHASGDRALSLLGRLLQEQVVLRDVLQAQQQSILREQATLHSAMREQATLHSAMQQHQQDLLRKFDDLQLSITSAMGQTQMFPGLKQEEQQSEHNVDVTDCDLELDAKKWFKKIDGDHNGILTAHELKSLLTEWTLSARQQIKDKLNLKSPADVDHLIAVADRDHDGVVNENEFIAVVKMCKEKGGLPHHHFEVPQRLLQEYGIKHAQQRHSTSCFKHLRHFVLSRCFESGMAAVILINILVMFTSLQLQGLHFGWKLGLRNQDSNFKDVEDYFIFFEQVFCSIYMVELLLRMWAIGRQFHRPVSNLLDALVVVLSCFDTFVLQPMEINFFNMSVLRLSRLTRLARLSRALRFSEKLSELRVMVRTLYQSLRGVVWSVLLLGCIIVTGGILMAQLSLFFLEDDAMDVNTSIWLYTHFGTTFAAVYTMFECTFSGHWWFFMRPLIEEVNSMFAFFWVFWVVFVNFATMRVVSAIFLQQTMRVSVLDAEKCAMHQLKRKGELCQNLRLIFQSADTSGDGSISQEEFDAMMSHQPIVDEFAEMGLDKDEVSAFFTVLISDDGLADYREFIDGALAMASSAPTLNMLKATQQSLKIQSQLRDILKSVKPLAKLS